MFEAFLRKLNFNVNKKSVKRRHSYNLQMASGASRLKKTTTFEAVPLRKKRLTLRFRRLHSYPHVCRVVVVGRISVGNSDARCKKEGYQLDLKRNG